MISANNHTSSLAAMATMGIRVYLTVADLIHPNEQETQALNQVFYISDIQQFYTKITANDTGTIADYEVTQMRATMLQSFDSARNYVANSIVFHDGKMWISSVNALAGQPAPGVSANWKTIGGGQSVPSWISSASYAAGEIISYNGLLYRANSAVAPAGTEPDSNTKWTLVEPHRTALWSGTSKYATNDIVAHNGVLYRAVSNVNAGTSSPDSSIAWESLESYRMPVFKATASYKAGDIVSYNGVIYTAKVDNAAGSDPTDKSLWSSIESKTVPTWNAYNSYSKNDIIANDGVLYKASVAIASNSANPSLNSDWVKMDMGGKLSGSFSISSAYSKGDMVASDGVIYFATKDIAAGSASVPTLTNPDWTAYGGAAAAANTAQNFDSSVTYVDGQIVVYNGITYQAKGNVSGTSTPPTNPAEWTPIVTNAVPTWADDSAYVSGSIIAYNGKLYVAKTTTPVTTTTPDADAANWKLITDDLLTNIDGGSPDTVFGGTSPLDAGTV